MLPAPWGPGPGSRLGRDLVPWWAERESSGFLLRLPVRCGGQAWVLRVVWGLRVLWCLESLSTVFQQDARFEAAKVAVALASLTDAEGGLNEHGRRAQGSHRML